MAWPHRLTVLNISQLLLLSALLSACHGKDAKKESDGSAAPKSASAGTADSAKAPAPEPEKPVVGSAVLENSQLSDHYSLPGIVKGDGLVTVAAMSGGIVSQCKIRLGQKVQAGQTLCTIRNDDPSATYLPFAVVAPAAGVVGTINTVEGSRVNKGDSLMVLVRPGTQRVVVEVPVADGQKIKLNQLGLWQSGAADLVGDAGPSRVKSSDPKSSTNSGDKSSKVAKAGNTGKSAVAGVSEQDEVEAGAGIKLKVVGVSPLADPVTRTLHVELEALHQEALGATGTIGFVSFALGVRIGIEVVEEAVQYRGLEPFLRVIEGDKVRWTPVKLGRAQKGKIELLQGLSAGAQIVVSSPRYVADGDAVTVQSAAVSRK